MFRKPKKGKAKAAAGMRRRRKEEDSDDEGKNDDGDTSALLSEARKRTKLLGRKGGDDEDNGNKDDAVVMHKYSTDDNRKRQADLITSTAQEHPEEHNAIREGGKAERGDDGIFRDQTRSKLLAGPIKVKGHIRTTCRFDYQPDICKDYKETGFCGFGDTCIYLHDRGDTLSGWQIEQQWEEEQKRKKQQQEADIQNFMDGTTTKSSDDGMTTTTISLDGLPYACHLCRKPFQKPVVTGCGHYFCEACIMNQVRAQDKTTCPVCSKDTHGVFNQPTRLISMKRKVLGVAKARQDNSWEEFAKAFTTRSDENGEED